MNKNKNILENLNWRYATKKFDLTKKINPEDLETLKEALRLTPSSYGLQPWKFLIIENQELRSKLREYSWGQAQVTDASHLFVLCTHTDITEDFIDQHISTTAAIRNIDPANLQGYGNFVKAQMKALTPEQKKTWNSKQAYIALGQLMAVCAELRIDATPMEGFEPENYNKILGLNERGLHATLVCPVGYRSEDDTAQHTTKVRKPLNELFEKH
jgi:nitroreductase/dihydropteridine reductase